MLTILLLAVAPVAAPAACPAETPQVIAAPAAGRARPLGSEPKAEAYLAVRHSEAGCAKPIKVGERAAR